MFPIRSRPRERTATFAYVHAPNPLSFTHDECRRIVDQHGHDLQTSTIYGGVVDRTRRTSEVKGIELSHDSAWMFEKIRAAAIALNEHWWALDLTGIHPFVQLLRYTEGQFQTWHRDGVVGAFSHRKLTVSVNLSAPESYEGGQLQFLDGAEATVPPDEVRQRGAICVFPGYELHQVTPVTRGVRWALVTFIEGPPFR